MALTAPRADPRRAKRSRKRARRSAGPSRIQIVAAAVVAIAGVAALAWLGNPTSETTTPTSIDPSRSVTAVAQSPRVRGEASAPVTIEEWADFQCPACGAFARGTEQQLLTTYVAKGQVRIVFRHMAFLGAESQWAAEASECAGAEGRFWQMHDKLYASQLGENRGAFSKDNLKKLGDAIGLGPAFASCLDSGRYAQAVRDETRAGKTRGVQATPTLFVNGRKIEGAVPFDQLKAIVDPMLPAR